MYQGSHDQVAGSSRLRSLAGFYGDLACQLEVLFGVVFNDVDRRLTQDHAGGFQVIVAENFRGTGVSQLIGKPLLN